MIGERRGIGCREGRAGYPETPRKIAPTPASSARTSRKSGPDRVAGWPERRPEERDRSHRYLRQQADLVSNKLDQCYGQMTPWSSIRSVGAVALRAPRPGEPTAV